MSASIIPPSSDGNNRVLTDDASHSDMHDYMKAQYDSDTPIAQGNAPASVAPLISRLARFKIRIADIDHYMAEPGPLDLDVCQFLPTHCLVLKVPVVRVYGANEAGQKTCLHIHRAYPYFYVPYEGSLEPAQLQGYILQLGLSLNHAACITFNSPQDPRKSQYVAAITPIKGIPFYGYHVGYSYFLKIYLFNPDYESRIVDLMRSGAIMGTKFQPFEAHIPFRLQFFIDYNLYGMGWLELEEALLRNEVPVPMIGDHPKRLTRASVENSRIWSPQNDPGRNSHCEIEMDSTVDRIVNRDKAPERITHDSLGECFKPPSLTAQVPSMASLWEDDARRRKANNLPSQELPKTQIRDPVSIPWLNYDMNKHIVADLVREMMSQTQTKTPTQGDFDNFKIEEDPLAASFMTAYQSVEFLCPRETYDADDSLESRSQMTQEASFTYDEADSSILVDESLLSEATGAFHEADMDARKGIFKGLAGLEGIEEQAEDDDFPLPDIDDFQEEDLMDEEDLWDGFNSSELETQGEAAEEDPRVKTGNHIPQFDGGGDEESLHRSSDYRKTAADEWRRTVSSARKQRGSSSPTSKARAAKSKRFCEIMTTTSTLPLSPDPDSTQRPTRTLSPTRAPGNFNKRKATTPPLTTDPKDPEAARFSKLPVTAVNNMKEQTIQSPINLPRTIFQYVEIPRHSRKSSSHEGVKRSKKSNTPVEAVHAVARLVRTISDDPILDDDGDDQEREKIEPLFKEPDFMSQERGPLLRDVASDTQAVRGMAYQYPQPASPDQNYFLSAIDEMWSSPSEPKSQETPALLHSPGRPGSPDLIPARSLLQPSTQSYVVQISSQETIMSDSSSESLSLEMAQPAQHSRRYSTIVEQTFIHEPFATQGVSDCTPLDGDEDAYDHPRHSKSGESQQKIPGDVLAEDSILQESIDVGFSQLESSKKLLTTESDSPSASHVSRVYRFSLAPPTTQELLSSFKDLGLPNFVHQKPYFSNEADVPSRVKVFGGKEFRLQSNGIKGMPNFKGSHDLGRNALPGTGFRVWEPNQIPPSHEDILAWLVEEERRKEASLRSAADLSTQKRRERISQIEAPTPKNPFGYKNSPTRVAASIAVEKDFLDVLSLEVHCLTRGGLLPDPKFDAIQVVFYCWQTDREGLISNGWVPGYRVGIFTHAKAGMMRKLAAGRLGFDIHVAENEGDMLNTLINYVLELDPDILAGYEVHSLSWGYLVDRYQTLFGLDMSKLLSRVRPLKPPVLSKSAIEARDSYNTKHHTGLKVTGRHLFNVWRLIRGEVALTNYGYCNVVFHVLQQRVPHYSHETLTKWWTSGIALHQSRVIRHYLHRVQYTLQLIESQELISRTSEFARVFGVDFFSIISRGSQYKVESMMVRLAKPENFIMITPSRAQVAGQRALEVIPMVMEPESGFYEDPVIVLDFQSLYPSVMIAYNICYSTCLGKLGGGTKLGVTDYNIQEGVLPLVEEHLQIAPNNVMFVNQDIRRGLLGRMLAEILDTRVMIKKAMKEYPNNKSLLKLLDARQLSLKFVANVTYGYTSASFSGRMPGIEIADSIVLSGRETLERAIRFVNEHPRWNARVVYGDTDSMFVHLKGRTRQEAFDVGYDIAETITRMNPRPVKLKFEKVYHPCFLVTKKRYVGNAFETPTQKEGVFDAKGIETIRRDGVPAVQKIMEACIKTMFKSQDLSVVKSYFVRQLGKILEGRAPVPDLMFGKEVRMGGYSEKGVPPPGAVVSARRMDLDPRAEPQHGERVPYVVVYGDPGARLTDQVVEPKELLRNKNLRLNGEYYIRKHVIPSMERIFQLAGADVKSWYEEMPRIQRALPLNHAVTSSSTATSPTAASAASAASGSKSEPAAVGEATSTSTTAKAQHQQQHPQSQEEVQDTVMMDDQGGALSSPGITAQAPSGPPRFKPRRRGGKGFVSVGSRIDRYYQSMLCTVCGNMVAGQNPQKELCGDCTSENGRVKSILTMQNRLRKAEKLFQATVEVCSSCCRSAPNGGIGVGEIGAGARINTGTELVACESLECNVFWQRRRAQDTVLATHKLTDRVMNELKEVDLSF